ncbi:MAG: sigma-54 dependent transcriptional regulator [bacterium]
MTQKRQENVDDSLTQKIGLMGESGPFLQIMESVRQVAPTNITVLITGESGTGKEMIARAIHALSPRREKPLLTVNCGAIPEGILESELFGHEKGSFTGATDMKKGYFEVADGGVLFLDEIGEMPLATQVKLLRVLEEKEFMRVGGTKIHQVDVRVLAATNKDLETAITRGEFRKDLFYRLNAVNIDVPSLRQRKEDIRLLAVRFAKEVCRENEIPYPGFTEEAFEFLQNQSWPGNIRELRNIVERVIILEKGQKIDRPMLESHMSKTHDTDRNLPVVTHKTSEQAEREIIYRALLDIRVAVEQIRSLILGIRPQSLDDTAFVHEMPDSSSPSLDMNNEPTLKEVERIQIEKALRRYRGNRRKTAKTLGIGERTLYRKLKEYNLE